MTQEPHLSNVAGPGFVARYSRICLFCGVLPFARYRFLRYTRLRSSSAPIPLSVVPISQSV